MRAVLDTVAPNKLLALHITSMVALTDSILNALRGLIMLKPFIPSVTWYEESC